MNRIQSKNHRIGTYEVNKIYLSCSCLMANFIFLIMELMRYFLVIRIDSNLLKTKVTLITNHNSFFEELLKNCFSFWSNQGSFFVKL